MTSPVPYWRPMNLGKRGVCERQTHCCRARRLIQEPLYIFDSKQSTGIQEHLWCPSAIRSKRQIYKSWHTHHTQAISHRQPDWLTGIIVSMMSSTMMISKPNRIGQHRPGCYAHFCEINCQPIIHSSWAWKSTQGPTSGIACINANNSIYSGHQFLASHHNLYRNSSYIVFWIHMRLVEKNWFAAHFAVQTSLCTSITFRDEWQPSPPSAIEITGSFKIIDGQILILALERPCGESSFGDFVDSLYRATYQVRWGCFDRYNQRSAKVWKSKKRGAPIRSHQITRCALATGLALLPFKCGKQTCPCTIYLSRDSKTYNTEQDCCLCRMILGGNKRLRAF